MCMLSSLEWYKNEINRKLHINLLTINQLSPSLKCKLPGFRFHKKTEPLPWFVQIGGCWMCSLLGHMTCRNNTYVRRKQTLIIVYTGKFHQPSPKPEVSNPSSPLSANRFHCKQTRIQVIRTFRLTCLMMQHVIMSVSIWIIKSNPFSFLHVFQG